MKEFEFIKYIRKNNSKPYGGLIKGIGDDCAVIEKDKNTFFVWSADMIAEGTHFRADDGYEDIGHKAVAVSISDIAAMGADPKYITVSIGMPRGFRLSSVKKIYDGIFETCQKYGVQLAGGDTVKAESLVIDISIIGTVDKKKLITRSGAKPGDLVLVTGPVRDGRKEHLKFLPRLLESSFLARRYKPSSMIDVSDGIAPDIGRICQESNVGCLLFQENIPLSPGVSIDDAMHYGESFELLFTMNEKNAEKLPSHSEEIDLAGFFVIGIVTHVSHGMKMVMPSGRKVNIQMRGYDHFGKEKALKR